MTPEQFQSTRLPTKLTFNESEAARHVLCNGMDIEKSAALMHVDIERLKEIVFMFY